MAINLRHEFNEAMAFAHKTGYGTKEQNYWCDRARNLALALQTQELERIARALEEGNKK